MKKVIITGGLGYIGMELSKLYSGKSREYEVIVLDNKFHAGRVSKLKKWGIKYFEGDILDQNSLEALFNNVDIVFHLAGITNVATTSKESDIKHDKLVTEVGVIGSKNVIDLLPDNAKIIFPSTHVVFEGLKNVAKNINEEYKTFPVLNYSVGKVQTEKDLIKSKKNYVILRLGSVYGYSGDSTRLNIMTNLFAKISSEGGTIKLFANGEQYKSLVSVYDVARCMEFVAENEKINRETFNCVNENLQVKKVANICKSINKDVNILKTSDIVPNKGYTLANKKIIEAGFEFRFSLEESIKEMIHKWKHELADLPQEIVEGGKDDFIDNRGLISNYYMQEGIDMVGYVESKEGTVRGNHFHPVQTQKCILLTGQYISVTKDLLNEESVVETRLINAGEMSTIPPNVAHTMIFLKDSTFVNLVSGNRSHEKFNLTHTIKYNLVDEDLSLFLLQNYKSECRVCRGNKLETVLSLGLSPLANNLLTKKNSHYRKYPLELIVCKDCTNTQLSVVVPPDEMFKDYLYVSSTSEIFKNHFNLLANQLKKELKLSKSSLVVDIGSNDGIFLEPLKNLGIGHLGVDPAKNIVKIANKNNLSTLAGYFNSKMVDKILNKYKKANLVTAFNVFAHSDNLHQLVDDIEKLLSRKGRFIFEVQYLIDNMRENLIDNIYHEHVNYWTVTSLMKFFESHNLNIYKVEHIDTHGGSIRVYCSNDKLITIDKSVEKFLKGEKDFRINTLKVFKKYKDNINQKKVESIKKLKDYKNKNEIVVGYGAPAKATTLLNFYNVKADLIEFVIDDNKLKENMFIPGTEIKILNQSKVSKDRKYKIIVLAWNFYESIVENNKKFFVNSTFDKLN